MHALFDQIRAHAKDADEAGRKEILDGLRNLTYSLETPQDSIQRIIFYNFRLAAARIGMDMNLFNFLVDASKPLTVQELSEKTGAAPLLLGRILRYLASIGDIEETDQDTFTANNITHNLTIEGFDGGIHHYFDTMGPAVQALPEFLKENNYQDFNDPAYTPLQKGWNTDLPAFLWVQTKPNLLNYFNQWMAVQRLGMPTWLDFYPVREAAQHLDPAREFFVDIGGGLGHQSVALRKTLPDLQNRIIVQDMEPVLEHAIKHPGVELMAYDFWQPQPIKGAKIYYLRNIIHDYPDDKAIVILGNIIEALGPDSKILIDDMIVPNKNAHWQTTQLDFQMMTSLASLERTHDQWYELIGKAGLKIIKTYTYTTSLQDNIIECVPL